MTGETPRQLRARRGFSLSYKGKTLLSVIDPIAQADRLVDTVSKLDRTLYFCPSPLYGYGLARLLNNMSADSAVLCVETDEKLMDLSLKTMEESLRDHPRFRLLRTGDALSLCTYVRELWGGRSFRRVEILRLSGGWQLDPELYESLAAALRREIALDWGNAMTLVKLGRRYIRNALRNLALIPGAFPLSAVNFAADPVLVLGAGPSLDGVLDGLEGFFGALSPMESVSTGRPSLKTRPFRIICVDTALSPLKERNIKPDLVVALESQHWNLRDFIGCGGWELPVAMDLSALPATAGFLGGRSFLFVTPWTSLSLFDRMRTAGLLPEALPPLGSVGLTAVAAALRVSSGPVVIGGIDFSFTLDRFHARSTPGHLDRLGRQNRFLGLISAETAFRRGVFAGTSKSGMPVRSDPAMQTYRDLFSREFAGETRLRDIIGPGLPLGIRALSPEAAFTLLRSSPHPASPPPEGGKKRPPAEAVESFILRERQTLLTLRRILTGETALVSEQLDALLDECDYLWAHFPEWAGAGGRRPPGTEISFLKRVRVEIDPSVRILDLVLGELRGLSSA
jgi:hypothetical protein